jgi:chromosomal replication initiation ATPase DnaA
MHIPVSDVLKKDRHQSVVHIRMMIAYLLKRDRYLNMSLKSIGFTIGKRDHSTVIHAIKRIEADMDCYPEFRELLYDCFMYVYGSDSYFPENYKKKLVIREAV